MYRVAFTL